MGRGGVWMLCLGRHMMIDEVVSTMRRPEYDRELNDLSQCVKRSNIY